MRAADLRWRAVGWTLLRWALGGVFIYAGATKLPYAASLAASIVRFQIVPEVLIHPMALGLPPLEVFCGIALLVGPWKRQAALGIALLCGVFLAALMSAGARGIAVDCSCFGAAAVEPLWSLIVRDSFLFGGALIIYLRLLRQALRQHAEIGTHSTVLNKPISCLH